uniref:Ribonuclease H-like domain, reverse transcriptase, RNA-dependent DNA polymerase n=1 Tax=Tanacetum cinerariifolium TaxID=118510 RepID=A0A6L2L1I1_TANCI|nr:ribonuclease H-like domain, reverse transcriptase, RNA-dependent DNA polymerase [Tanacetum cinerariifolium]
MDVKSAFLYRRIKEEVYVCQPPGFEDPNFPDKVYKVEKALYGLHQASRACQDKYVAEVLKKFDFVNVKTASTPMESNKPLIKDEEAKDVDVHLYRSMIGSLMYLTTYWPDITFAVCAYARFQVNPKTSHLYDVKRIFRYLKGQPKLGLWYHKDSPFDLEAYFDSDYVGASLDKKSITGGCQFLGKRSISWQCKKQTIIANSTTEVEYVTTANYCRQLMLLAHSLSAASWKLMLPSIKLQLQVTVNGAQGYDQEKFQALVDKTKVIITEDSIKSDICFDDAEGTAYLLNEVIFEGLARMSAKTTTLNEFSSTMASAIICLADNQKFNFSKYIFDDMKQKSRRKQRKEEEVSNDESEDEDHVPTCSSDPLPSGEDSSILNKLMVFCTSLHEHVLDLQEANDAQAKEIAALKKKVTKLNKWRKSRSGGLRRLKKIGSGRRVKSPMEKDGLGAQEDASKHGKMIDEIDQNAEIELGDEALGKTNDDEMFRVNDFAREEVVMDTTTGKHEEQVIDVGTAVKDSVAPTTDVTEDEITMAQALVALKSIKPKVVDKRKAKMIKPEVPIKKKDQMRIDEEYARKLQAVEQEATRLSRAQQDEEANNSWDNISDDGDKVIIEATPISSRFPTFIDYKIHKEGKKTYFKIIRADGNSQVYQTFEKMFKNFNREDLEVLWAIVKDRFKKEKLVDDMDNLLFRTLKPCLSIMWKIRYGHTNKD